MPTHCAPPCRAGPQAPRVASGATRRRAGCLCPRCRGRRNSVSLSRWPPPGPDKAIVRVRACTPLFPASGPSSARAFLSCCSPRTVTRRCPGLRPSTLAWPPGSREAAAPIAQTKSPGTGPGAAHPDCRAGRGFPAGVTDGCHEPCSFCGSVRPILRLSGRGWVLWRLPAEHLCGLSVLSGSRLFCLC